jgi:hypothetical protein
MNKILILISKITYICNMLETLISIYKTFTTVKDNFSKTVNKKYKETVNSISDPFSDSFLNNMYYTFRNNKCYQFFYDVKYYFFNLYRFSRILWKFRDWDYSYTLEMLKQCLIFQKHNMEKFAFYDSKKEQKKVQTCILLLNRILDDKYYSKTNMFIEKSNLKHYEYADYLEKQDFEYLFHILKKHIRTWWV